MADRPLTCQPLHRSLGAAESEKHAAVRLHLHADPRRPDRSRSRFARRDRAGGGRPSHRLQGRRPADRGTGRGSRPDPCRRRRPATSKSSRSTASASSPRSRRRCRSGWTICSAVPTSPTCCRGSPAGRSATFRSPVGSAGIRAPSKARSTRSSPVRGRSPGTTACTASTCLPGVRGTDAARLVREVCAAAGKPVIVAGSVDSHERVAACRAAGAAGFTVGTAALDGPVPGRCSRPGEPTRRDPRLGRGAVETVKIGINLHESVLNP